jgi:hypothetical protein
VIVEPIVTPTPPFHKTPLPFSLFWEKEAKGMRVKENLI